MGELAAYVKRNSKFVTLKDGDSFEGTYHGFKIGVSELDPDKEIAIYAVKDDEGNPKHWKTSAVAVAKYFDDKPEGFKFRVTRQGQKQQTRYIFDDPTKDEYGADMDIPPGIDD